MPARIQLRRIRGWRKPEGAVVVSRPSKWGNPWTTKDCSYSSPAECAAEFERYITTRTELGYPTDRYPSDGEIRRELAGKDLCCWCPLIDADGNPVPSHADTLLRIANAHATMDAPPVA
jgi:hypothetical protein